MAMQWPFFISSLILGFGWIIMYGPAGFVSTQFAPGLRRRPVEPLLHPRDGDHRGRRPGADRLRVLRQRTAAVRRLAGVRRAGLRRRAARILGQVIIPMLRPPMVYSSILVFSMSVETLCVPLLYGQPVGIDVFSTFLFRNGLQSVDPDYSVLGAASVVILCVTISLVAIQAKLLKDAAALRLGPRQGDPPPQARPRLAQVGQHRRSSPSTWSSVR